MAMYTLHTGRVWLPINMQQQRRADTTRTPAAVGFVESDPSSSASQGYPGPQTHKLQQTATQSHAAKTSVQVFARRWFTKRSGRDANSSLSLFAPFKDLPPDGKSLLVADETCDPEERFCRTPLHVWEDKCKACSGTGSASARGRGRHSAFVCLACHGIGYVRRTSTRTIPDFSNGHMTLGRNSAPPEKK